MPMEVKCPDVEKCSYAINAEDFKNYCCTSPYTCYFFKERHTRKERPLIWMTVKKVEKSAVH